MCALSLYQNNVFFFMYKLFQISAVTPVEETCVQHILLFQH